MTKPIQSDFISDVVCPWCVIGLGELQIALSRMTDVVEPTITFHPFELNPSMAREGETLGEHIARKYGSTPEQSDAARAMIRARAAEVGFSIKTGANSRIYNTFDAHRLLHWAGEMGGQLDLKRALFDAYFTKGLNIGDRDVLVAAAKSAGLDPKAADEVLERGDYAQHVRAAEQGWSSAGITSVPAIVINQRFLISGGQPADVFEQALRRIAANEALENA